MSKGKGTQGDWFQLPDEDEKPLIALVEKYGMSRVLGVLARLQREGDRLAAVGKKAAKAALDSL